MRGEKSSRRDSMKVAQYEVLGWRLKKRRVPEGAVGLRDVFSAFFWRKGDGKGEDCDQL